MIRKDLLIFKNYDVNKDCMEIYEQMMNISLYLENDNFFIKFLYANCNEMQEEDLFVEILELRDFIAELFNNMFQRRATITFPNIYYYIKLYHKNKKNIKLVGRFIKTLNKVNRLNEKNAKKVSIDYNI